MDNLLLQIVVSNLWLFPSFLLIFRPLRIYVLTIISHSLEEIPSFKLNTKITWASYKTAIGNSLIHNITRGYTTRMDKVQIDADFKTYKEYGGNSYIDNLYDEYKKLDLK